jgi:hypothetical protein
MSSTLGIFLMMNNYFHDVATALLLASGIALWIIMKRLGNNTDEAVQRYFLELYRSMTKLAKFALVWIVAGGIPRTIFYTRFEWANAAGKGQVPALMVKHIMVFSLVAAGAYLWLKIGRAVKAIQARLRENS